MKHKQILAGLLCSALVLGGLVRPVHGAGTAIYPATYEFGSNSDEDHGTAAMLAETGIERIYYTDEETGVTLPCWVYVPKNDNGSVPENLPVVLYLHGYSDGGNTTTAIGVHNAVLYRLMQLRNDPQWQAIVLCPQTPEAMSSDANLLLAKDRWLSMTPASASERWTFCNIPSWDMSQYPRAKNLRAALNFLQSVQAQYQADADRTYVTGMSMGGTAVWDLLLRNEDQLFAAAVPICGSGDPSLAIHAKEIPIRVFHGSLDNTVTPEGSRRMYKALRQYGNITYTEYADEAHMSWYSAYSNTIDDDGDGLCNIDDLLVWMFNQSRNGPLDGKTDTDPLRQMVQLARQAEPASYASEDYASLQEAGSTGENLLAQENPSKAACDEAVSVIDGLLNKEHVNLCAGRATRESGHYQNFSSALAVDGNLNSCWDASLADDPWMQVDLGKAYSLDSVKAVTFVSNRIYHYEIYGSVDGISWKQIAVKDDSTQSTAEGKRWELAGNALVRYLKVRGVSNSANNSFHLAELEAYGTDELGRLQNLITQAEQVLKKEEFYTTSSRKDLQEELEKAQKLPIAVETTRQQLEETADLLESALENLKERADCTLLEWLCQDIAAVDQTELKQSAR